MKQMVILGLSLASFLAVATPSLACGAMKHSTQVKAAQQEKLPAKTSCYKGRPGRRQPGLGVRCYSQ